jgi:hypothetical protein
VFPNFMIPFQRIVIINLQVYCCSQSNSVSNFASKVWYPFQVSLSHFSHTCSLPICTFLYTVSKCNRSLNFSQDNSITLCLMWKNGEIMRQIIAFCYRICLNVSGKARHTARLSLLLQVTFLPLSVASCCVFI